MVCVYLVCPFTKRTPAKTHSQLALTMIDPAINTGWFDIVESTNKSARSIQDLFIKPAIFVSLKLLLSISSLTFPIIVRILKSSTKLFPSSTSPDHRDTLTTFLLSDGFLSVRSLSIMTSYPLTSNG
jgi:hypothetical protein